MSLSYVTTSWDDGHIEDLRLLRLLERYHLRGTFYLCPGALDNSVLNSLLDVGNSHEIGAHTIHHLDLTGLPEAVIQEEVVGSKERLEQITGQAVDMFCYPWGKYNELVLGIVKQAGFKGARTIQRFVLREPDHFFQMGTTVHAFPHPYLPHQIKWGDWRFSLMSNAYAVKNILRLRLPLSAYRSWVELAKKTFDHVVHNGGVWHLWGHSWEVSKLDIWNQLEEVLRYVSGRREVTYVTNGELVARLSQLRQARTDR